jgi:hypothetical protein
MPHDAANKKRRSKMSQEKIIIWWDSNSEPEKWCVHVLEKNSQREYEVVLGSGSSDFPIDVNNLGPFEEDLLIQSIKAVFPCAEISLKLC